MAHSYQSNICPSPDEQRMGPVVIDLSWASPERIPTPPRTPDSDRSHSSGLFNGQQPQDDNGTRGHERWQQFTYIPSTSSISSGHDHQPPLTPGLPGISFFPAPPSFLPHASDKDSDDKKTLPPLHSRFDSLTGSVLDDSPSTMYISVNPFKPPPMETPEYVVYPYSHPLTMIKFLYNYLQRQVYSHFLLRLPMFYWSRVARIFEEAKMTMPEIEKMALQAMGSITIQELQLTSPASANLKVTWEGFIDSLLREWKTLNIVSVLLLSAIMTLLQIDAAGSDPITRNCALISLICALMSLLYGCIYIIRFANMRKTYKALEWAQMAQKTKTSIWWNVWVLLALPAVWLAWSIILYIACIMAFVWRSGTSGLESTLVLSKRAELAIRITISIILSVGILYFGLIMNTLRRYGDKMDKQFKKELDRSVQERRRRSYYNYEKTYLGHNNPYYGASPPESLSVMQQYVSRWFKRAKVMDFRFQTCVSKQMPGYLIERSFTYEKWEKFISEAFSVWNGKSSISDPSYGGSNPPRPQDAVAQLLEKWNRKYFQPRSTLGVLCHEYIDLFPHSPSFSIYVVDMTPIDDEPISIAERFGPVPKWLSRIDIFDQPGRRGRSTRRILGRTSIFLSQNPMDGRVRFPNRQEGPLMHNDSVTTNNYPQTQSTFISDSSNFQPNIPFSVYSPRKLDGESPQYLPSMRERSPLTPNIRPESPPETQITDNNYPHHTQPTVVPNQPQHNLMMSMPHAAFPLLYPTYPGTPPPPAKAGPSKDRTSLCSGYYVAPSSMPVWDRPPCPPLPDPDLESFDADAWMSPALRRWRFRSLSRRQSGSESLDADAWMSPALRRWRSRDLSRRQKLRSNRFIPLRTPWPVYSSALRQSTEPPVSYTNQTVTSGALSASENLMPLVVHDMVDDSNRQLRQPLTANVQPHHTHRYTSQSQDISTTHTCANLPPAADSALRLQLQLSPDILVDGSDWRLRHESNHNDVNVSARRRSTSTSFRSFSRSPPQPREQDVPLSPVDLLGSSSLVHGPQTSLMRSGAENSQQMGVTFQDEAPRRERDRTTRSERTRVDSRPLADADNEGKPSSVQALCHSRTVSDSINDIVVGPWTVDHLSLRTIFDPQ